MLNTILSTNDMKNLKKGETAIGFTYECSKTHAKIKIVDTIIEGVLYAGVVEAMDLEEVQDKLTKANLKAFYKGEAFEQEIKLNGLNCIVLNDGDAEHYGQVSCQCVEKIYVHCR